jgi:LPS-assembly protein
VFQGLRANDDPGKTPRILPSISGYYETDPLSGGARLYGAGNIESLSRPEDSQYKRASLTTGVKVPYVSDGGHVFEAASEIRGDVYSVNDLSLSNGTTFDGEKTRAIPQASLSWRYPLMTQLSGGSALTIEPTALAVAQTNGGNPEEIPNQDNRVVELTDTNIFSPHRMPGYDSIDSGSRAAYGMRSQLLFARGQSIDAMLGQSYNTNETPFPNSRKLGEQLSDYIGRVGVNYQPFSISYRFALDKNDFTASRNEIWTSYGDPSLQLSLAYLTIQNSPYVSDSEEVLGNGKIQLIDEWSVYGNARRDVLNNAMVSAASGLIYENECFSFLTQLQRIYTRDRDIEPASEFSVRLGFKNFGEFGNR